MVDIRELGLMTFSQASRRWNKESSYVYQMYTKYPNKFLEGTVDFVKTSGDGKGTYLITRSGMEYLTGKTEEGANAERWKVIVIKDSNIVDEVTTNSEIEAQKKMMQFVRKYVQDIGITLEDVPKAMYLDTAKKNLGIKFDYGITIYYKKEKW